MERRSVMRKKKTPKENKLTPEQLLQQQAMEELISDYSAKGYTVKTKAISMTKANLYALVTGGPLALILFIVYIAKWRSGSLGFTKLIILIVGMLALFVLHELVHGATWASFCKNKWKSIRFGIMAEMLTPYCHCMEPLTLNQYIIGALMPLIVTGLIPYIISYIIGSYVLMVLSMVMILGAGGDISAVLMVLGEKNITLLLDHPTLCGCVIFKKPE